MKKIDKKASEIKVSVVANKEQWIEEQEKARKELTKNLTVKGFRKGNIPEDIAKKHINEDRVWSKALPKMLDILVKDAAKELKDEDILSGPTYIIDKVSSTELGITFVYPMFPELDLSNYQNHGIKYAVEKIEEALIDKDIETLRNKHAILKVKDGPIEKGDVANFDFEGFKDGKPFDGGKATGYELEIGSGHFIPGFEDQMIGLKKGDEKDIELSFPKDYHVEDLKGAPVVFKVKINDVKIKEVPELSDDLVKEFNIPNVKTVKELKEYIREVLEKQAVEKAKDKFMKEYLEKTFKEMEITVPEQILVKEMQQQKKSLEEQYKKQGIDLQTWLKASNISPEQFTKDIKKQSTDRLKTALLFAAIAKKEKIELKEEEYEQEYEKLSKVYGQPVDVLKQTIRKEQLQVPMTNAKVVELIIGKK